MTHSTDDITFRVRSVGPGESDYSSNATGTADTSFLDSSYTTGLSLTSGTLNWTQTNSQDFTEIWVRPVGTTAWADFLELTGSTNTSGAIPPSWMFTAAGVQIMVETYNTGGANDSFSNIVTEYPQNAISAPEITSVTPETVGGEDGILVAWTGTDSSETLSLLDAAGAYVGPAVDPTLGYASGSNSSAFFSYASMGVSGYPAPSGKFVMVATNGSGSSNPSNVVDLSMPAAPTNIAAAPLTGGVIDVNWTNNAYNATGGTIQRSSDGGMTWTSLSSSLAANAESYQDTTAIAGTSYVYQIAKDGTNDSGTVDSAYDTMATPTTVPAAAKYIVSVKADGTNSMKANGSDQVNLKTTIADKTTKVDVTKDQINHTEILVSPAPSAGEIKIDNDATGLFPDYKAWLTADSGTTPGTYQIKVIVKDDAGNIVGTSNAITVIVTAP